VKKIPAFLIMTLALAPRLGAEAATAPDAAALTRLLKEFLDGASRNDAAMHDRFWAPDLIYTGSSGRRIGKPDIMKDVRGPASPSPAPAAPAPAPSPSPAPAGPQTVYTAEDIRIQQYGNTAVVAFRLVGTTATAEPQVARYLNSGTFLKRNGRWQVVNWQATRMRRPEEEDRTAAAALGAALRQALLGTEAKALEPLLDEGFVWTRGAGEPLTRKQLLERLPAGPLGDAGLEAASAVVSLFGDTAGVRGAGSTLTLVFDGAAWKAVALHTSGTP
jgi:hypothetical protein